jgi:ribosomal-protein-alanine N-acetyltransferase
LLLAVNDAVIRLREAREADLDGLFELDQVCFPPGIAYSKAEFKSLLRSRRSVGIVAESGDAIAGFVFAQSRRYPNLKVYSIVTIDVAPQYRRSGVGRTLMTTIESRLKAAAVDLLRLEVAVDNGPALRFYEGLGFQVLGRIPRYYNDDLDAFVMEKALRPAPTFIG